MTTAPSGGTLYVVSTPIGNLKDITLRALEVLAAVDLIACEDTRRTGILLQQYQIRVPLLSYYEYNKVKRSEKILQRLQEGKTVALVSDAGTPGISDPGAVLIRQALDLGIPVEAIPGATALITALVISGKPTHSFTFYGFLPVKRTARRSALAAMKAQQRTAVVYESGHRLVKTLEDIVEVFAGGDIVVARELTKKFEEVRRESASAALAYFQQHSPRGEFVLVL